MVYTSTFIYEIIYTHLQLFHHRNECIFYVIIPPYSSAKSTVTVQQTDEVEPLFHNLHCKFALATQYYYITVCFMSPILSPSLLIILFFSGTFVEMCVDLCECMSAHRIYIHIVAVFQVLPERSSQSEDTENDRVLAYGRSVKVRSLD